MLLERHAVLKSTQARALAWARAGAPSGAAVVADAQTGGRGRLDHTWASPPGGLYLSVILRAPRTSPLLLPLALGATVADALAPFAAGLALKWPNDLLAVTPGRPPRKVAGILVDMIDRPPLGPALVAGVGVNVAAPAEAYPEEIRPHIVQLSELAGRSVAVREVESRVLPAVRGAPEALDSPEAAARLIARLRAALYGRGRRARLDGRPAGVIAEVADDGALLLADGPTMVRVVAGEVAVEEA